MVLLLLLHLTLGCRVVRTVKVGFPSKKIRNSLQKTVKVGDPLHAEDLVCMVYQ
jgi:hypothetical protein